MLRKIFFLVLLAFTNQAFGLVCQDTNSPIHFFTEILIWKIKTGSSENWAQEIPPPGANQNVKIYGVPFKWDPGIRVGGSYFLEGNDWNILFAYTGLQTKGNNAVAATTGGIHSPFLGNFFVNNVTGANITGPSYQSANIQWKISFNVIDLEIGRVFLIDPGFRIQPILGLKCGIINQKIYSNWFNPTVATTFTSASENLDNNFWGVGPAIGFNTNWSIFEFLNGSINLFSHFSGSLQWGHWSFKDTYRNNTPASVSVGINPVRGAASMARGFVGLVWIGCVAETELSIKLGYESQIWFNQSQYYSLNMGRLNNLMSLQGGVLGFDIIF